MITDKLKYMKNSTELDEVQRNEKKLLSEHLVFVAIPACEVQNLSNFSGGWGPSATMAFSLASLLPVKLGQPYSKTLTFLQYKAAISLQDSAIMCLRRARRSFHRPAHDTSMHDQLFILIVSEARLLTLVYTFLIILLIYSMQCIVSMWMTKKQLLAMFKALLMSSLQQAPLCPLHVYLDIRCQQHYVTETKPPQS